MLALRSNAAFTLGDVVLGQGIPQTLTGAGAVDITSLVTHVVTTAADALTLADGTEDQIKFIVMTTDGGNGTLTPTNLGNGSTITFDDVGDSAFLLFTNGSWHWMGGTATLA
jgi:hypothetical protein